MSPDKNVEAVRTKLLERSQVGLAKYGVTTERTDTDLVGWLNHLQEELMDAAVYVQRSMVEVEAQEPVAFAYYSDKYKKPMLEQTATARGYEGEWKIVPLFAAPVVSPDVEKLIADHNADSAACHEQFMEVSREFMSLKAELEGERAAALNYRNDAIEARKKCDVLIAELEAARNGFVEWDAEHIKTGNIYRVVGEALDATNMSRGMHMVIYRREGKTFVREASEFQAKFRAAIEQAKGGAA